MRELDQRFPDARPMTRRGWLAFAATLLAAGVLPRAARAMRLRRAGKHPAPRPGVDASRMPPAEAVRARGGNAVAAFAEARRIPEVLDGIRCNCGCADADGMRSLLSCYEGKDAMALDCPICQGQGRLAFRLHGRGSSLDEIRAAVDARYG